MKLWLARGLLETRLLGTGGLFLRQSFRSALFSGPCDQVFSVLQRHGQGQ